MLGVGPGRQKEGPHASPLARPHPRLMIAQAAHVRFSRRSCGTQLVRTRRLLNRETSLTCATYHVTLLEVIRSFRHAGVERFFRTGSKAGIQPAHARKLENQLGTLNRASQPKDMDVPGWQLHPLKGDMDGHWAVSVSGNWRLTFRFDEGDAEVVDYVDYH